MNGPKFQLQFPFVGFIGGKLLMNFQWKIVKAMVIHIHCSIMCVMLKSEMEYVLSKLSNVCLLWNWWTS